MFHKNYITQSYSTIKYSLNSKYTDKINYLIQSLLGIIFGSRNIRTSSYNCKMPLN